MGTLSIKTPVSTATFNPGTGVSGQTFDNYAVNSMALQADGKILLAGQFTRVNGQTRRGIARLLANGTVESTATFNSGTGVAGGEANVNCVAVQADGKILIAGDFTTVNGQPRKGIARLLADGTVEGAASFSPGVGVDGFVVSMAVQADGKILIGGFFTSVDGQPRNRIARLLPDGTVESTDTFDAGTGVDGFVGNIAVQADGKILINGQFTTVNGQPRNGLARLVNDAAPQSLTAPETARVQWIRGGAAPEVGHATFELSTNGGVEWTLLGNGIRIPGGWELTGLSLPGSGSLRARGRTFGGGSNGSSGLVEWVSAFSNLTPDVPVTIFDNSSGVFNGQQAASTNSWLAGKFCLGSQAYSLDSVTWLLNSGDISGKPHETTVRLQIYAHNAITGRPSASTGPTMVLAGTSNPITLVAGNLSTPFTWVPSAPFVLLANECYWAVLSVESGAIAYSAVTFSMPAGTAGTLGRSYSQNGGSSWVPTDLTSNYKMQIVGTPMAPPPTLTISKSGANALVVSWPFPSEGFNLQQKLELDAVSWAIPAEVVGNDGTNHFITVIAPTGHRFFRLHKP